MTSESKQSNSVPDMPLFEFMDTGKPGDIVQCRRCKKSFKRLFWFFYCLCDPCFQLFDAAKMAGRETLLFGPASGRDPPMESAEAWIRLNPSDVTGEGGIDE